MKYLAILEERRPFLKLYTEKSAITSADILNDKVLPFYSTGI